MVLGLGLTAMSAAAFPRYASAVDAFEIQVYDGTANDRGQPGLELHVNSVPSGLATASPPELPPHHQTHFTLEPSFGLTSFWEPGAYLQFALLPDGSFDFAGTKLRSKLMIPTSIGPGFRLGCNFELSWVRPAFDSERWGGEIRPIIAWENARWHVAANPILQLSFAGTAPGFAPALMAAFKIEGVVSFGLEYYADTGSIVSPAPAASQQHYLFEVVNLLGFRDVEVNLGVGEGLSAGSNRIVAKVIVGYRFTSLASEPAATILK
jgi:hypothetical protein